MPRQGCLLQSLLVMVATSSVTHATKIALHGGAGSGPINPALEWARAFESLHPDEVVVTVVSVGSGAAQNGLVGDVDCANKYSGHPALCSAQPSADSTAWGIGGGTFDDDWYELHESLDLRQLPALAGPIVVVYSKDITGTLGLEVDAGLNLSMEVVADVFAGRALYWDHEDVQALNPHVALPHERIHAVVRSDKSGMTGTFTAGIARANPWWTTGVHGAATVGKKPTWPIEENYTDTQDPNFAKADGQLGIGIHLLRTPFSIGYMELHEATKLQQFIGMARIGNTFSGQPVAPTTQTVTNAMGAFVHEFSRPNSTLAVEPLDPQQPEAYFLTRFAYFYVKRSAIANGDCYAAWLLKEFILFSQSDAGGEIAEHNGWVVPPQNVHDIVVSELGQMQCVDSATGADRSVIGYAPPRHRVCPPGMFVQKNATGEGVYAYVGCTPCPNGTFHPGAATPVFECVPCLQAAQAAGVGNINCTSSSSGVDSDSDSDSEDATMAVLVALIVVICIAAFIAALRRRRQHQIKMSPHDFDTAFEHLQSLGLIDDHDSRKPKEIKGLHINQIETLGKGAFGTVWKAVLDESSQGGPPGYMVAVKEVTNTITSPQAREDLLQEAAVMAQIGAHENLVSLVGVVTRGTCLVVVSYCEHGSLLDFLKKRASLDDPVSGFAKRLFAQGIAEGMAHLEEAGFVHRDLAARNVLIASGHVAKVADFGLSRDMDAGDGDGGDDENPSSGSNQGMYYTSSYGVYPLRWTSPEAMLEHKFSTKSDVWSFGIVLIELTKNGEMPYKGTANNVVMTQVMTGYQHPQPASCSDEMYQLILACLNMQPLMRPKFAAISGMIAKFKRDSVVSAAYVASASVAPMTDVRVVPPKPVETAQSEESPYTELISDSGLSQTSNTTSALVRAMSAKKREGRQATANRQLPIPQMYTSVNETIPNNPYTSDSMTSIV